MAHIGIDAGSVSVKLVVLNDEGGKLLGRYEKHRGHPLELAHEMLLAIPDKGQHTISITGSAGRLLGEILHVPTINEIVAQAFSTRSLHPHITTIIEMGGEDSKLIVLGPEGVEDFAMNSACAAGTGSFLDQQCERLRLTPDEMSELALKSQAPPRVAGRCSVFAKSDMIHLQQIAAPLHDIVAGLCFAVARNFRGSILKGRSIVGPVSFQGGVAANLGMRRAFKEVLGLQELFVPGDHALMGAHGAALKDLASGTLMPLDMEPLTRHLSSPRTFSTGGHSPLKREGDMFHQRHESRSRDVLHPVGETVEACMGIDIGSISTNLAVVDTEGRLLGKRYLMTAGQPIEAVRKGLGEIEAELAQNVRILGVGTTGSGRYMISDYLGADIVKNEITAQATAAAFIDPAVDTIFEIGGQDSKYISLRDGVIVDFEMNKACAAGTGSFIEEQAEKLDISVKKEFASCAFDSGCPTRLGERCTVFMENSLMSNLQRGAPKEDLLAGLAYSIVQNYINRVVAGKAIGQRVFFQGGVAFNKSVVAAFEKHLGLEVTVPDNHDVTGAIGMALIAMRHMKESGLTESSFMGWKAARSPYKLSSFACNSCSNMCEINTVKVEGRKKKLFYGGRCEKYDIDRKDTSHIPDLFGFRQEALRAELKEPAGDSPARPLVGIPNIFFFGEYLPFFSRLLDELGFDVLLSPVANRSIVDSGLQSVISEACFPVKVALGHIRWLKDNGAGPILIPSFINMGASPKAPPALACPHTQSIPYVARAAIDGLDLIAPRINMPVGQKGLAREIRNAFADYGISSALSKRAIKAAFEAQERFRQAMRLKGREVLSGITKDTVVIIGRAYNAFEPGMNLQIPSKLATLGVQAIPMDMLPLDSLSGQDDPDMYWLSGQRIMRAARYVSEHRHLYPIYIGNFSCGPDSFILKGFSRALAAEGKPFLHIEIDEHSADAGAITRCEAFLDSIKGTQSPLKHKTAAPVKDAPSLSETTNPHMPGNGGTQSPVRETHKASINGGPIASLPEISGAPAVHAGNRNGNGNGLSGRRVYIPRMADHALAVAAAFERAGVEAHVMPPSDSETARLGMKHTSGKECYPCVVTTGDMLKVAMDPSFEPEKSAFFMPSGSGPCRFGQYNVFHKMVLSDAGFDNVPVVAPAQSDETYSDLRALGGSFMLDMWKGIVATEMLYKSLRQCRPYELNKGESEEVYSGHLARLYDSLRGADGRVEDALMAARRDFEAIEVDTREPRPLIGIVGEIFVRTNSFSNEDLVRKIEDLGGEVWLSPIEEWFHYVGAVGLRASLIKRNYSAMLEGLLKRFLKRRVESRYTAIFEGFLKRPHEPLISEVLDKASRYIDDSFEGEAVLSVGKSVDLAQKGASGIVNAMPFGCMPGTIVTALMRALQRDLGVPSISMQYDGTESPTAELQLEAFMDQAVERVRVN